MQACAHQNDLNWIDSSAHLHRLLELTCEMRPQTNVFLLKIKIRYNICYIYNIVYYIYKTSNDSMRFQIQIS